VTRCCAAASNAVAVGMVYVLVRLVTSFHNGTAEVHALVAVHLPDFEASAYP
jgi:hypothetical protein